MNALIIGVGLIGGSLGLALKAAGWKVTLRDSSPGTLRLAEELGVGEADGAGETNAPDLVIVATPPDVTASIVVTALEEFPESVVIDVASVKEAIVREVRAQARERGLDASWYVGCHPMAGREVSGVVAARSDLFRGRPFVVVPHEDSCVRARALAHRVGAEVGATVVERDAATHDEAVAYVSHVPQLVSSLLASRLPHARHDALQLAGQGLRDTTRIAASDPRLWVEILSANAPAILPVLHGLRDDVDRLVGAFDDLISAHPHGGSRATIATTIARGNEGVKAIPGKHGGGTDHFAVHTVLVPDEPGELARLLADMGAAGINVEDLRLEHSLGLKVGLAHVSVPVQDDAALVAMLERRGWARAGEQ